MSNLWPRPEVLVDQPAPAWSGRFDGDDAKHLRWHQQISGAQPRANHEELARPPAALLGFASDAGVLRNQGRVGASEGPAALRAALASMAIHEERELVDVGDIVVPGDELEPGQERLGFAVNQILHAGMLPIVLGGGHETAYGSFTGLFQHVNSTSQGRIGILNLDAHFDLRDADQRSSGTPFRDIAKDLRKAGQDFRYAVVGISRPSNTRALFETADSLGVTYLEDEFCQPSQQDHVTEFVSEFLANIDVVHLSIDLDVLPASVAPGVSAPAAFGVPFEVIHAVCRQVVSSGKLALVDVVELNPRLDVDSRTARSAARLIHTLVGV